MISFLPLYLFMQPSTLQLAPLFSDGCVLQRDVPVRVWGTASPGRLVEVGIDNEARVPAVVSSTGDWEVELPPHHAGRSHTLIVNGEGAIKLNNVAFGEVWICSGQSNMQYHLVDDNAASQEIPASANPDIRMFTVPMATADTPQATVSAGKWEEAGPSTSGDFSAVGYYFAKRLQKELGVPIGMIHTSWGGTRIEAWTSRPANLAQGIAPSEFVDRLEFAKTDPATKRALEAWKAAGSPTGEFLDQGPKPETQGWATDSGDAGWGKAKAPGEWSTLGVLDLDHIDGGVWFRKKFSVPASWAGKPLTLHLGAIDDYDTTFLNGEKIGGIARETPGWWSIPRVYKIPAGALKEGENLLTVRIWDLGQDGGMVGKAEDMFVEGPNGEKMSLAGEWDYRVELTRPEPFAADPNVASVLYNAMIHPLRKYTVKGAIWYQGESNSDAAQDYHKRLPTMVADWRSTFHNHDLYFFAVQLAPYGGEGAQSTTYAVIREAQAHLRDLLPHTDSVVITDVGNETDIHPKDKGPVGERLALVAASSVYGKHVNSHSPRFKSAHVEGDKILIDFAFAGAGLTIKGGLNSLQEMPSDHLVGFQIAGADKKFVDADAKIVGKDQVEVSSAAIAAPKFVRFGFINYPKVNLWSLDGFPAETFRTDSD